MIEMKRGFFEDSDGDRWFVVGQDEAEHWLGHRHRKGLVYVSSGLFERYLEGCPDNVTGWDWQPTPARKSLGDDLRTALNDCGINPCVCDNNVNNAAVLFLRRRLKPPAGETLGQMFARHAGMIGRDKEREARAFIKELTGLEL